MRIFSIVKGFHKLTKNIAPELSSGELDRLKVITIRGKPKDELLVCKTFDISRATFYRWLGRYDSRDLRALQDKSRRTKRLRGPKWSYELIMAVKEIRQQYPRWGKEKLITYSAIGDIKPQHPL